MNETYEFTLKEDFKCVDDFVREMIFVLVGVSEVLNVWNDEDEERFMNLLERGFYSWNDFCFSEVRKCEWSFECLDETMRRRKIYLLKEDLKIYVKQDFR